MTNQRRHIAARHARAERQRDYEATLRAAMQADRKVLRQRESEDPGVRDTAEANRRSAHLARKPKEVSNDKT